MLKHALLFRVVHERDPNTIDQVFEEGYSEEAGSYNCDPFSVSEYIEEQCWIYYLVLQSKS